MTLRNLGLLILAITGRRIRRRRQALVSDNRAPFPETVPSEFGGPSWIRNDAGAVERDGPLQPRGESSAITNCKKSYSPAE